MVTRNNQQRSSPGAVENTSSDAMVEAMANKSESGGLLSFVAPTEFVEIPSKGKFYPPDHSLHNKEVVEIKFMTAKHEDILTSPTLLRKGVAIDRLLQDLVVDKSINLDSLLLGDKNAITIAARVTGYGEDYKTNITCPACNAVEENSFDLKELKHIFPTEEELEELKMELTSNNTFLITLPKTKVVLEARLLTGYDEIQLEKLNKAKKKHKFGGGEVNLTDRLKAIVISANGEIDRFQVEGFIDNMPALDAKYFRIAYAAITPNVDMKQYFKCGACAFEEEVNVPLTADFFWPQQ